MKIRMLQERRLGNPGDKKREPGTWLKDYLGSGIDYLFAPEEEGGPHVCEVEEPAHIQRMAGQTNSFVLLINGDEQPPKPDTTATSDDADDDDDGETGEVRKLEGSENTKPKKKEPANEKKPGAEKYEWPDIMDIDLADKKAWPGKKLSRYAAEVFGLGGDVTSPKKIREYARECYDIDLPNNQRSPHKLLNVLVKEIQAQKRAAAEVEE